uniref:Uncharacterized protein n=1 Tax=Ditylenchus dipsaci TaxID=166011 RepID=A0A915E606_9BILA
MFMYRQMMVYDIFVKEYLIQMHYELSPPSSTGCSSVAVSGHQKRRMLYEDKEHDFRRVLGNTGMISSLCKYLGEGRAKRRNRRSGRSRRRSQSVKRQWQDQELDGTELVISDTNIGDICPNESEPQIVPCSNKQAIQIQTDHHPMSFEDVTASECKRQKLDQTQSHQSGRRKQNHKELLEIDDPLSDLFANFDAASYEQSLQGTNNGPVQPTSLYSDRRIYSLTVPQMYQLASPFSCDKITQFNSNTLQQNRVIRKVVTSPGWQVFVIKDI